MDASSPRKKSALAKAVGLKLRLVRDLVLLGKVRIGRVTSEEDIADGFTKVLERLAFQKSRRMMGVMEIPGQGAAGPALVEAMIGGAVSAEMGVAASLREGPGSEATEHRLDQTLQEEQTRNAQGKHSVGSRLGLRSS